MTAKLSYSRTLGSRKAGAFVFILSASLMLVSSYLFAAEKVAGSEPARYRVESLKDISAEQGKKYLAEAEIGTVSQLPGPNTLLITAQPRELIKASAILRLVDSKEKFVIKTIFPASAARNLPSNEQIAAEVGNISIGTFSNPPTPAAETKAIIDIHNDAVIVIAPAEQLEKIITAIEQAPTLQKDGKIGTQQLQTRALGPVPYAPNEPGVTNDEPQDANESDEFFSKLLSSLSEAEKAAAELAKQPAKPSESSVVATVPEQEEQGKPFAGSEQVEESSFQAIKLPQSRAPSEPEPERDSTLEQVAVETEQPSEASPVLQKEREREPQVAEPVSESPALREPPKVRSYEPEPIANGNEVLKLNLPAKLTIVDFLGFVGEYLHLDYMYDPAKVKGDVTLKLQGKLRGPIKVKDLYPLLESVLKFKGFVMARKGNLVTIVPVAEALAIDPALQTDQGRVELGDVIITRVFNLKHISAANAKNLLDGMKLGLNINTSASAMGKLIVTGYAYRMARIEELLRMIDKPGEPRQFRFRQLKYTMAKTLTPKIKTLAEQLGTVSVAIGAAAPARITRKSGESAAAFRARQAKAAAAARAAAAKPTVGESAVYLDVDERTNRILMIGLEEQLVTIDKLIDTLDVEQQDLRTMRLYEIQNVGAEVVVKKLQDLGIIGGGRATAPASARPSKTK